MRYCFLVSCLLPLLAFGGRTVVSLSGPGWTCDGEAVSVPHCWNGIDGADGEPATSVGTNAYDRYGMSISPDTYVRKAAVYTRALPDPTPGRRQFVRFGAVSREATVKINGRLAGMHAGAFTAFTVEATDFLKPSGNTMEVVADNRYNPELAPLSADYTLMGGIYRDVTWIETPEVCIDPVTDGTDGVMLDVNTNGTVVATVRVLGGSEGTVKQTFRFDHPRLWSPEEPVLYPIRVEIPSGDAVDLHVGFRTVEFRADGFYLNGVRRKLRGVNRHQDVGAHGWAATPEEDVRDFQLIKELGADAVRLAHYPQSTRVMDLCDNLGLLVWCEEPATAAMHKGPVGNTWHNDVVEIFMDCSGEALGNWYQLIVDANGRWRKHVDGLRWEPKDIVAKTFIGDGFWTAEVLVPFDELKGFPDVKLPTTSANGVAWQGNLIRWRVGDLYLPKEQRVPGSTNCWSRLNTRGNHYNKDTSAFSEWKFRETVEK